MRALVLATAVLASTVLVACESPRPPADGGSDDATVDATAERDAAPDAGVDPTEVLDALLATCAVRLEACLATAACGCDDTEQCMRVDDDCRAQSMALAGSSPVQVVLDRDALAACHARVRQAGETCRYVSEIRYGCDLAAYIELRAEGERCVTDQASCLDGEGRCHGSLGRCFPRIREGEHCPATEWCVDGLVCNAAERCVRPRARGEACTRVRACEDGLVCVGGTCGDRLGAGAPCALPGDCGDGLTCIGDVCAAPASSACTTSSQCGRGEACFGERLATCVADVPDGGRCVRDGDCAETSFCSSSGECTAIPGVGEPCDGPCQDGAFCDAATLRCVAVVLPALGERCAAYVPFPAECAPGASCDRDSLTCVPPAAAGAPCDDADECAADHACIDHVCAPRPGPGEECGAFIPCRDGARCVTEDSVDTCITGLGAEGELCDEDAHCQPGLRCIDQRTCGPRLAVGSDCSPYSLEDVCVAGSRCRARAADGTGLCSGDLCRLSRIAL